MGYAAKVPVVELNTRKQYFLPHHGVYKKGSRKLRIVSAAVYQFRCLNDALLSIPSWQIQLPPVLIRFREGRIAFAADIEAMFSRIRLRPEDAVYHRFLWKEEGSEELITYQMNRLLFRDKCSPFVTIKVAEKPKAIKAIKKNMYMDDYLDSVRSDEAVNRARDVKQILAKGDFHFQDWISNVQNPAFSARKAY